MELYNTLTQKKEEFVPHTPGQVKMYTCGPTVYHYAHIGNLRSYIMEDVLEKYLRYAGYQVDRVMNITDVGHLSSDADTGEDKMLAGAKREHKTVLEIAKFYTDAFFADCEKLHIRKPDTVVPATTRVPDFIHMVEALLEKGYAYEAGGNVYFDTTKLEELLRLRQPDRRGPGRGRPGQRGGGREQAEQDRLRAVVHQVQVRGPGAEVGLPLGPGLPRLAHRVQLPSPCGSWGSTWTSTAAASTTPSPTTPTRSPRVRPTWATPGASTGSMCCTSTTPGAR